MIEAVLNRYRRAGATLPFADLAHDHDAAFEGYYWRFTDARRGRVVVALCGLSRNDAGRWAVVALAEHPSGVVRTVIVPEASGEARRFGVRAGDAVEASARRVHFTLGPGDELDLEILDPWPFARRPVGASGPAQLVPGLPQYWQPHLLGGRANGALTLGGRRIPLDGASVYAEKNWGTRFPAQWWWGQADAFDRGDACVAFAGGPVGVLGLSMRPTLLAARVGEQTLVLSPPLSIARAEVGSHGWRIRARSARYRVELEGEDAGTEVTLPVPVPNRRAVEPRSHQALAGTMRVLIRRGSRVLYSGESALAGLEREAG